MPAAESLVSSNGDGCDCDGDNASSPSAAVKLVASDCNGNGVISHGGDGGGYHSGAGKQGVKFSRHDAHEDSYVSVTSNDDSAAPVPALVPVNDNYDNGYSSREGLTEDLPNEKQVATEVDHASTGKADDHDNSVDTLYSGPLNKANGVESDSLPGASTQVTLANGTVPGYTDSKSSAAPGPNDQEPEVALSALESVIKDVDHPEPGQEDLQGPDVVVDGVNSREPDSAAALFDDAIESIHGNCNGDLVSSINSKASEGVVDLEPSVSASVQDPKEVDDSSLESVVDGVDSSQLDLGAIEASHVNPEIDVGISVSISSESVEVDEISQSAPTKQQSDDAHDDFPAGTDMILQNGTVEDSPDHYVSDPVPSLAPAQDNQESEDATVGLESDFHSVCSSDMAKSTDKSREDNSVLFSNNPLDANVSESTCTNQQNVDNDDLSARTPENLLDGAVEESVLCQLVHHEIGFETSPALRHDDQELKVAASVLVSDIDTVDNHKPESAVNESEEDNLVSVSSTSSRTDVRQSISTDQQTSKSLDEFVAPQESDATCHDPHLVEVQFHAEPVTLVDELKPEVLEQLESSLAGTGKTSIEEEANTELPSEEYRDQQTKSLVGIIQSDLDKENDTDLSEYKVDLISSKSTAIETVSNHTGNHLPVPSCGGFQDLKELNKINESLASGVSLLEETDTVGKPDDSVEDVQKSTGDDNFQHETNVDEVCNPVMEVPVQSSDKLLGIPGEHEIVLESSKSAESNVISLNKVTKPATDLDSVIAGNPEGAISYPASEEQSTEIVPLEDVNSDELLQSMHRCSTNNTTPRTEFELGITDSMGKLSSHQVDDAHDDPEVTVLDGPSNTTSVPSDTETRSGADEEMNSSTINSEDSTLASKFEVSGSSVVIDENIPNSTPEIRDGEHEGHQLPVIDIQRRDNLIGQESEKIEKSHSNEASTPELESSTTDTLAGQDVSVGLLTRPFQFLIRIPRFDDSKVREQINLSQLLVDEKTKIRDDFRHEMQKLKANCYGYSAEYQDAVSNAKSSKHSVKSKRVEIDSLQVVINKVKNAISVDDIDARISSMEHMMQHETLPLKEEKQYIREIKQLKQLRDQLSSNIGNHDEVKKAMNDREEIEERLKILRKELDQLKDEVVKKEVIARAAQKKLEDENIKLREVRSQFEEANDTRQSAYQHLQSLRKELFDKNKLFRTYKDNAAAASDFAARRDTEALHRLCHNQVETVMDLWNSDDEFRKEYIKCNVRSTVRRLGTLDGRSLGPDEKPPVLPSFERLDRSFSKQNTVSAAETSPPKQVNSVIPVDDVLAADNKKVIEGDEKNQTAKNAEVVKQTLGNGNGPIIFQGMGSNDEIDEKEYIPTKEELELARKAEELNKKESEAKFREQRRVEEKLKALEALERKKKNAEKAVMRAELRAQKEAEQKEKEREKRLRKKERKKGSGSEGLDGNSTGESTPSSEILAETVKEAEVRDTLAASSAPKRPQKPSLVTKQSKTKSIPPPLRNRSKRKMQQWMWVILTCVLVVILFVLGNVGFFSNLSSLRQRNYNSH